MKHCSLLIVSAIVTTLALVTPFAWASDVPDLDYAEELIEEIIHDQTVPRDIIDNYETWLDFKPLEKPLDPRIKKSGSYTI